MDVILHVGAHRTATTSFQTYLRANRATLAAQGIGFWAPWRTRGGLLNGIDDRPVSSRVAQRGAGRVALNLDASRRGGVRTLVVSDENMLGSLRRCLRRRALYPGAGERLARLATAFGTPARVTLQIRSLDDWWASAIAYLIPRGEDLPAPGALDKISHARRSWRGVITDIACACPGTQVQVTVFETFRAQPDLLLAAMSGRRAVPRAVPGAFLANRRPDAACLRDTMAGRGAIPDALNALPAAAHWPLFDDAQARRLRETYADDLFWLRAGADGLATLTEESEPARPRLNLAAAAMKRGSTDDGPARKLAQER